MKLYKDICSTWISRTCAEIFFLTDWRHKRLKNTIDLLLFYGEYFYGFSESEEVSEKSSTDKWFSSELFLASFVRNPEAAIRGVLFTLKNTCERPHL